ncbi:hypothetical protein BASA60_010150 [Batrachochytrium salamandrivorans]|nr:hypothetical protein BASA60_010150 [Batrachochytrium salamandrivorans]
MLTRIDLLLARQRELEHDQEEKLHRNAKQIQHQAELQASASSRNIINLRYGVIQAQSDLAKLKGYFSSCERRNERISAELESYKHDYLTHIDEQHDLTTEREVLYAEKNKIQALVDINQKNQETVCNEYKEELNSLQLKSTREQDFEMEKNKLQTQIDALKKAYDFSGTVALGRIEAEKKKQAIEFENQIQELNSLRTKESESNRNTVASLERDLAEFKIGQTTQGFNVGQERMAQLQASITSKDAEILFLKDTVRLECEERMGLVAMVAKLQLGMKNGSCNTNVMDSASNQSIPKGDASGLYGIL